MFSKVLIANRGEIAVRIIKACRLMGISTVAVYSDPDERSLHVQYADEARWIGPAEPLSSYLNMEAIIEAARISGAEAIHPGYGFLAENAAFAKKCHEEGIIFIGPPYEALELMGDKMASRKLMSEHGIPIIPGMTSLGKEIEELEKLAAEIGYPVLIKPAAGGGGKGMKIISDQNQLLRGAESSIREAEKAFGDGTIYLEKLLERPKHIEFQILVDHYGQSVHLFERECSIQRRYQKIIEETPSPALTSELRIRMGETAKKIALLAGYQNAGTVEFLLDENNNFYFLEMNARIQVEHPITEMTTGVDIVCEQLRIASGEKLRFHQDDLFQRGHSMECRIYAEDPENDFLPCPGKIVAMKEPKGPGIRVDSGIYEGFDVPIHYDPILSKLIILGENREITLKKMKLALSDYQILGIKTTISYLYHLISHPEFQAGRTHTNFIKEHMPHWRRESGRFRNIALMAVAIEEFERRRKESFNEGGGSIQTRPSPWEVIGHWRIGESGK